MIYSMTAFSRLELKGTWGEASWEIRSVNQRYLETTFRLPESLRGLENKLRETVRKKVTRGKVECFLRINANAPQDSLTINENVAQQVLSSLKWLKEQAGEGEINLMEVLRYPTVVEAPEQDWEQIGQDIFAGFEKLLTDFVENRAREGERLNDLLQQRLTGISEEAEKVRAKMPEILQWQRDRLAQRFADAAVTVDPQRLEQELVMLAQRLDVAEELDRLQLHIQETQRILQKGGACGRRLDFMMQELNREANTLASKSINAEITASSVEIKVLIEQMREQIQNVE